MAVPAAFATSSNASLAIDPGNPARWAVFRSRYAAELRAFDTRWLETVGDRMAARGLAATPHAT